MMFERELAPDSFASADEAVSAGNRAKAQTGASCRKKEEARVAESATGAVLQKMKELFMAGDLRPGDLLPPENELAQRMGVSRSAIREAMKILDAFGVIAVKRGDGTYVADAISARNVNPLLFQLAFEAGDFRHIVELRQCVELSIVRLIIQHATADDLEGMAAILEQMAEEIDSSGIDTNRIFDYELLFHQALGEATHNPLMNRVYEFVMEFFMPSILVTVNKVTTDSGRESLALHQAILSAVAERDIVRAQFAIMDSLRAWRDSYLRQSSD